jgi:uncharacterized protein (UPF0147 family)
MSKVGCLNVSVSLKDTDVFKEIVNVTKKFVEDERVPVEVKREFKENILLITNKEKS